MYEIKTEGLSVTNTAKFKTINIRIVKIKISYRFLTNKNIKKGKPIVGFSNPIAINRLDRKGFCLTSK
jgi:hypothetical protein